LLPALDLRKASRDRLVNESRTVHDNAIIQFDADLLGLLTCALGGRGCKARVASGIYVPITRAT
jgi:hypothetical protein